MKEFGFSANDSIEGWWKGAMGTKWETLVRLSTIKINKKYMVVRDIPGYYL